LGGVSRLILLEEADEFLMPVAAHALADDLAVEHVERGEQGCRAVALIVMGHRAAAAAFHRQPRLGAVERLDLRLLIKRQHQRVLRWIDVKADNIFDLGGKLGIVGQLEAAEPMRLQTVCGPDPLHAAKADAGGFGHRPAGPVRRLARRLTRQRHFDHPLDRGCRQRLFAARTRRVVQQSINPLGHEPRLPTPDRRLALAGLALDRHRANPIAAQQHNPRPPYVLLQAVPRSDHRFQPLTVARTKSHLNALLHPHKLAHLRANGNLLLVSIH